jgi:hypothetical protein
MPVLGLPSCLLPLFFPTEALASPDHSFWRIFDTSSKFGLQLQTLASRLRALYPQILQEKLDFWKLAQIMALCSVLPGFWYLRRRYRKNTSISWRPMDLSQNGVSDIKKSVEINGKSPVLPC